MFRAFGLDNSPKADLWTGEDDSVASAEYEETSATGDDLSNPWEQEAFGDGFGAGSSAKSKSSAGVGRLGGTGSAGPAPTSARRSPTAPKKPSPRRSESPAAPSWPGAVSESKDEFARRDNRPLDLDFPESSAPIAAPEPVMPPPRRRMIPMRKVWERVGSIVPGGSPADVKDAALREAEHAASGDVRSRDAMVRLYMFYMRAGDVDSAGRTAERWSEKDPLDPDALTARADVAAARGDRDGAIRILGSVVDVRPGDHKAQWRLARLHRWAGRAKMGCRHSMAVAQIRRTDEKLLAEAVRCARGAGEEALGRQLLDAADEKTRSATDRLLSSSSPDTDALDGDLRLEATWETSEDLDLAMIHPDGHRVSWLGAPTRSVITARDVLSTTREGLSLRGAEPGEYVLEVTRGGTGDRTVRGTVRVTAGKQTREIPFELSAERTRYGLAKISMRSRLVPL
jgi:hypothetical protein